MVWPGEAILGCCAMLRRAIVYRSDRLFEGDLGERERSGGGADGKHVGQMLTVVDTTK